MRGTFLLSLALLGVYGASGQPNLSFQQPHHLSASLTQHAQLTCSINGSAMVLTFTLFKEVDAVDAVFTRNFSDPTVNSLGNFDSILGVANGITGDGTSVNPFTFVLEASCASSPPALAGALEASALLEPLTMTSVDIKIVSKSLYQADMLDQLNLPNDVIYTAKCDCDNAGEVVLTTNLTMVIALDEQPIDPLVELVVLKTYNDEFNVQIFSTPTFTYAYLVVETDPNSPSFGVFVHSCYMCNSAGCSRPTDDFKFEIIDVNGCGPYTFISGFNYDANLNLTRSGRFQATQLFKISTVYFQCNVQFCYSLDDPRCPDYCAYNTPGRKRRQAVDPRPDSKTYKVQTTLTVRDDNGKSGLKVVYGPNGEPMVIKDDGATVAASDDEVVGLVAAIIILAGLLFVGVIVAIFVFFRMSRNKGKDEKTIK